MVRILRRSLKWLPRPVKAFLKRVQPIIVPPRILPLSYFQRVRLMLKFAEVDSSICPHTQEEIISFITAFLAIPPTKEGCIVEAGVYKGGSAAKFSLAAKHANRELVLFDSYQGLPGNDELHDRSILGHSIEVWFNEGAFHGSMQEVKRNIEKYGRPEVCTYVKGWFDERLFSLVVDGHSQAMADSSS